eukprot:XP_001704471.1 Hypothetical protein GL50803_36481 [Giardia lamblia ATCC 50803]
MLPSVRGCHRALRWLCPGKRSHSRGHAGLSGPAGG